MRERISQLAGGDIYQPTPVISEIPEVEISIPYGQNYRGDIHFSSGNQLAFRGLVYSDDSRVILPQGTFTGVNIYIPYQVQADELAEGTVLSGSFYVIYNGGELQIPYRFEIMKNGREFLIPLESCEDFAEYARTHPKGAGDLILSKDFYRLPFMDDMALRAVYDGLLRAGNHQNLLEEFLCAAGVKERVVLSLEKGPDSYVVEEAELKEALVLHTNTWGYLPVEVTSDHPAVQIELAAFNTRHYPEGIIRVPFTIRRDRLHGGRNYARIQIRTPFDTITCEWVLSSLPLTGRSRKSRERHAERLEFWKAFLKFISGKGDRKETLDYLQYVWEELNADVEPDEHQKLYRAAISLWKKDRELAAMILDDVRPTIEANRREDADGYCAYLYLQVQVTESWERKEQMLKILKLYEEQGDVSEFLFLLQLSMDEGLHDRPMEMLERMERYFRKGSCSPFLYLEACRIYNRHPDILKSLGDFELQTLLFGARYELLNEKTALHVASMAGKERTYRSKLGRILTLLYKTYGKDDILGGMCYILIRGDQKEPRHFYWYQKGVERDIRLTRLYDYYLSTVPEDYPEAFPREILLYFSYNSPKNSESQLVLYRNLFRYAQNDEALMQSYYEQMKSFAREQIHEGRVDHDLAQLYKYVLRPDWVDDRMARLLPDIVCAREYRLECTNLTEAILVFGEKENEKSFTIHNGVTCVPIYTDLCRVIFADKEGNRYAGIPCHTQDLFSDMDTILERCHEIYPRHAMTRLAACTYALEQPKLTMMQARLVKKEMEVRDLHRQYKKRQMIAYTDYLINRKDPDEDEILACVRSTSITMDQRRQLVELLVAQGQLTEAGRQARKIGFRELPVPTLLRLVSLTIQNSLYTKDDLLLDMCSYLFEVGEYDDAVLKYMGTYYNSGSARMYPILREITERNLPSHNMEERLLGQMLFADIRENLDSVFRIYLLKGVGDRVLIHAYFAVKCNDFFTGGYSVDPEVFRFVRKLLQDPEERRQVPQICILALAKYYAGQSSLEDEERDVCEELVSELYRSGLTFAWMKNLSGKIHLPESMEQREWIEYHGQPDQSLEIRFQILPEMEGKEPVRMAYPQIYPGVYVKSFLLFAGEELLYEVIRPEPGRMVTLARDSRKGQESSSADHSRFAELNRIQVRAQDSEHVCDWQQDVLAYGMQEAWTEQIFKVNFDKVIIRKEETPDDGICNDEA